MKFSLTVQLTYSALTAFECSRSDMSLRIVSAAPDAVAISPALTLLELLASRGWSRKAVGSLDRGKVLPRAGEMGSKPFKLFEVKGGKDFQSVRTVHGEPQADNPMIVFVSGPHDKP